MQIEIEGLRGLHADLERAARNAGIGANEGLQKAGLKIVAEAKKNLQSNGTNNTRTLSNSGKVQKDKDGVDAGFFSSDSKQGYAAAVEFGRGPSKKKSPDGITLAMSLKDWVKRKLGGGYMGPKKSHAGKSSEEILEETVQNIARTIHLHGTKPQPFFTPAVKKYEEEVSEIVSNMVGEKLG